MGDYKVSLKGAEEEEEGDRHHRRRTSSSSDLNRSGHDGSRRRRRAAREEGNLTTSGHNRRSRNSEEGRRSSERRGDREHRSDHRPSSRRARRSEHTPRSKSEHDSGGDDWFSFGEGADSANFDGFQGDEPNEGNDDSKNNDSNQEDDEAPDGTPNSRARRRRPDSGSRRPSTRPALNRSNSLRQRSGARGLSDRRLEMVKANSVAGHDLIEGGRGRTAQPRRVNSVGRRPRNSMPTRSRSDATGFVRRESMKALYRTKPEDLGGSSHHGAAAQRRASIQMNPEAAAAVANPEQLERLGSGSQHTDSSAKRSMRALPIDGGSGLVVNASNSTDSGDSEEHNSTDPKWLERRATRQDQIMSIAQDVRERFQEEQEQADMEEAAHLKKSDDPEGEQDEDDQPMDVRTKKTALQQLTRVITKTGAVTKSAAKGTVNAVVDPKRAAKRVGHLSKDVGKATIKTVLDPKKAAISVGKVTKNVTVGSAKVGAGITKGVAKGTFGATKTVVKGSVNATTSVAKGTVKGTKKVVKGTVRVVKGKDKHGKHRTGMENYDASQLAERNQSSLFDRVAQMVEEEEHEEQQHLSPTRAAAAPLKAASILMPTNLVDGKQGSWDV